MNNIKKGRLEAIIFFLLSPLLSLPLIFLQIRRKDSFALVLISAFLGLLSFSYIPHFSNDKTRYFERYEKFIGLDWTSYLVHLEETKRPDFIFETLVFSFAKLGVNIQFLFLIITFFTVYSIFLFIKKVIEAESKTLYYFNIGTIFLILFSFSIGDLFSGIRFYFGTSIFIWAIYFLFFCKNYKKAALFLLLSIFTHFSLLFFIPILFVAYLYPEQKSPKIILLFSMIFLFIPKDFFENLLGMIQLSESYSNKSVSYLSDDREFSENLLILNGIRNLWLYFSLGYLLLRKGDFSRIYILVVLFTSVVNITYPISLVFNRYTILLKVLFLTFYLLLWYRRQMSLKVLTMISILFFLNFVVDIIVYRDNFSASFHWEDMLFIIDFLTNKIVPSDFLY